MGTPGRWGWFRRHWYDVGLVVAALAVAWVARRWNDADLLQRLLVLNFAALLVHQFEEYHWPGGEPAIINLLMQPSSRPDVRPDRYPLNQNSAMFINVVAAYGFYLVPCFFPNVVWLGLAPTLFGFGQFGMHGVLTPKKLGSFYNPGLAAVVLLHLPIGAWYIYAIHARGMVGRTDWLAAAFYLAAFMGIVMRKLGYGLLADEHSPYPFDAVEMRRFDVAGKIARQRGRKR
jgi:hypothetical protein